MNVSYFNAHESAGMAVRAHLFILVFFVILTICSGKNNFLINESSFSYKLTTNFKKKKYIIY